jgi:hypothetical protein
MEEHFQSEDDMTDPVKQVEAEAPRSPSARDNLMLLIGSFPLHTDDRGDDNQVLHDAFSGDYDTRTEAIYQLVDDILAEVSAEAAPVKAEALDEKGRAAAINALMDLNPDASHATRAERAIRAYLASSLPEAPVVPVGKEGADGAPQRLWISFADLGEFQPRHIRQWQSAPFGDGIEYIRATLVATPPALTAAVDGAARDLLAALDPYALNPEAFNAWAALDIALSPGIPEGEPVAWRILITDMRGSTHYVYTEVLPFQPLADSGVRIRREPEPLFAHPLPTRSAKP